MRIFPHRTVLTILITVLATACGGGSGSSLRAGPRRLMLGDLAAIVIVPTYENLAAQAAGLAAATAQLDGTADATTLAAVQDAWRRTRGAWKQSEAFGFGPAETLRTPAKIDWTPVRPDRIEAEIAGDGELTADYVDDLGANVKGFLALEYLLFDPDGGDAAVLDALAANARRRRFVEALAEDLRDQTVVLRDAWEPMVGNFSAELADAGAGSTVYPTVKSAVDDVVNQLVFVSETVADEQLLAALGTRTGGVPDPQIIAAHRSRNGRADLLDNLTGIEDVYFVTYAGRSGESLSAIVASLSPAVDGALSLSMRRSMETATRIPAPLEQALTTDAELVERAQARAKELMQRLQIDLISVLGSTLRFSPNDGD